MIGKAPGHRTASCSACVLTRASPAGRPTRIPPFSDNNEVDDEEVGPTRQSAHTGTAARLTSMIGLCAFVRAPQGDEGEGDEDGTLSGPVCLDDPASSLTPHVRLCARRQRRGRERRRGGRGGGRRRGEQRGKRRRGRGGRGGRRKRRGGGWGRWGHRGSGRVC